MWQFCTIFVVALLHGDSLKLLYNCLVYPSLIYGNAAWGSACKNNLKSLVTTQKKIIRVLNFKQKYEHTAPLFQNLNALTIENINKYISLIYLFKSLHSNSNFMFTRYVPGYYNTRLANSLSLVVPNIRLTHSRQSIKFLGSKLCNSLPLYLREFDNLNVFKVNLKKYLLSNLS